MKPIDEGVAVFMIATAVIIDILGLVPLVGTILAFIAAMIFGMWFGHFHYSLMHKRTFGFLGTIAAEFIPGLDMWFFWPQFVIKSIRKQRAECAV